MHLSQIKLASVFALIALVLAVFLSRGRTTDLDDWHSGVLFGDESGVVTFHDSSSAIAAASRPNVCTVLLFGARWDGFFRAFVASDRYSQDLSKALQEDGRTKNDVQVAFLEYSGSSSGPSSIPPKLLPTPTMGSYNWYGYRGGARLWDGSRECLLERATTRGEKSVWNLECIRRLCGVDSSPAIRKAEMVRTSTPIQ